ncbi:hypothetical protein H4W00_002484 [Psychrobacter sp. PL19]|uniref:hypothetical protein n=1 Tax=Psychrobacter sp. PL19 TaxID=2760711 RepID=UPI002FF0D159
MVAQQSGIFTGDGGFDLEVGGKTTLIGGAITTTDAAVAAGRNKYVSKGGIVTQDIENYSNYEGDAIQVGLSLGNTTGKPQATMNGLGYGTDGDSNSSTTKAGITGIAGNSGITTDNQAEYAGALENVFDATRVNEELGAQVDITKEFGKEAPKAVAEFSGNRQTQLILDGDLEGAEKWADGGAYRVALHTLVGAIATGNVEGALATGTTAVSIPAVDKYLEEQGVDETTRDALLLGLSAAAGAIVGGDTASTASSVNQTQNNFLSHKDRKALNALLGKAKRNGGLSLKDSENLIYLVQYDQVTNILLEAYRKNPSSLSVTDRKFLEVALNDLMAKGGYDAVAAKTLISGSSAAGYTTDNFLNAPKVASEVSNARGDFWDNPLKFLSYTRPKSENQEVYNEALATSSINTRQRELSRLGGDAIFVSPGALGLALRGALAAKGVYDVGYGGAAIYDGQYKAGIVKVGIGALEIVPAVALGSVKAGTNRLNNQNKNRTFESTDPHVADVANYIESKYPGLIKNVNVPVRRGDGSLITDADILLTNGTIIQIKSGGGKGLTSQIQRTETGTGAKTVGYGPDLKPSIVKNGQGKVTKNIDELIEMVK